MLPRSGRWGQVSWGLEGDGFLDEEGRIFLAEGTAHAKAQWQEGAW